MSFPQEEKDEEAIDFDDEEEEADDVLADLPQKSKPPDKREMKRMSTLSSLFNRGNKDKLSKDEQQARDMANPDGTINPEAALDNVQRSRRLMKVVVGLGVLVCGSIITILVQASKNRATVNEGTVEVKDAIAKSTSTSVGMDNNGHSVLQDVHTNQQVSVRGFGDPFATETKLDPITGRRLSCMNIGEVAELFRDAVSRTEASITFMDENGIESEVVPVNGHFVDHGHTLHFGTGKDGVTMIMDSDACNTGVLPTDVQDDFQVESEESVAGDGALSEEEEDSDTDGVFKRGLREPTSALALVPASPSQKEVLDRNRNEFQMAKDDVRNGRRVQTSTSVPVCSGSNCASESDFELRTDLIEASECPIGRELTENECQVAASELEVGEFDGVWNRDGAENLPCGCFLWKYPDYNMVLYRNEQAGCSAASSYNLGMICKKVPRFDEALKIVFVTSTTYNGNLGGVNGANSKCQARANAAGLAGTFKAWISSSSVSQPLNSVWNHNGGHPYYLVDGTKIADEWGDFVDQNLDHEINVNEYGVTVTDPSRVWTNTNWNGHRINSDHCNNWSSGSNQYSGKYGSLNKKNHEWSWQGGKPCNWISRLYCIQQDILSNSPTSSPTKSPSTSPSLSPTSNPSESPSTSPSLSPTSNPSESPSTSPSLSPTSNPSESPTTSPTTASPTNSPTTSPTRNPTESPSTSPSLSPTISLCTISETYSDGSAGDLTLDATTGALTLNGDTTDVRFLDDTTLGTAHDETVTFENVNEFIIPQDTTMNQLGTLVIYAKRIVIDGTLDGNGRGYPGAVATQTDYWATANNRAWSGTTPVCVVENEDRSLFLQYSSVHTGDIPPPNFGSNTLTPRTPCHDEDGNSVDGGQGQGGRDDGVDKSGGGGAGHGGIGGRGGEQSPENWGNDGGESGRAYDNDSSGALLPGSGGGGGAGGEGGAGGAGGAAVLLYAEEIIINGIITVNGNTGGRGGPEGYDGSTRGGGGGGSGGSVKLSSCTLTAGSGASIEAKGGNGGQGRGWGYGGGGGGGGMVIFVSDPANYIDNGMSVKVNGGEEGNGDSYESRRGSPGNVGKQYMNGVVV